MKQSAEMKVALKAALEAGKIARKMFGKKIKVKPKGIKGFVTSADFACEKKIIKVISKKFPGDAFFAEESGKSADEAVREWLIDPIDGTTNFVYGFPFFSVSIAFAENREVKAGVVFNPVSRNLFSAEKGKGAFLNGKKIHVSGRKKLGDSIIIAGYPEEPKELVEKSIQINNELAYTARRVRGMGSAALEMCFVAAGVFDGFAQISLSPWDYAAAKLIVEEAGGIVTDFNGKKIDLKERHSVCASNRFIREELLKKVKV
ncbi:MAG: inositol monophosphatase family protein [Candidatus Diapherotrites archaeon]